MNKIGQNTFYKTVILTIIIHFCFINNLYSDNQNNRNHIKLSDSVGEIISIKSSKDITVIINNNKPALHDNLYVQKENQLIIFEVSKIQNNQATLTIVDGDFNHLKKGDIIYATKGNNVNTSNAVVNKTDKPVQSQYEFSDKVGKVWSATDSDKIEIFVETIQNTNMGDYVYVNKKNGDIVKLKVIELMHTKVYAKVISGDGLEKDQEVYSTIKEVVNEYDKTNKLINQKIIYSLENEMGKNAFLLKTILFNNLSGSNHLRTMVGAEIDWDANIFRYFGFSGGLGYIIPVVPSSKKNLIRWPLTGIALGILGLVGGAPEALILIAFDGFTIHIPFYRYILRIETRLSGLGLSPLIELKAGLIYRWKNLNIYASLGVGTFQTVVSPSSTYLNQCYGILIFLN